MGLRFRRAGGSSFPKSISKIQVKASTSSRRGRFLIERYAVAGHVVAQLKEHGDPRHLGGEVKPA